MYSPVYDGQLVVVDPSKGTRKLLGEPVSAKVLVEALSSTGVVS